MSPREPGVSARGRAWIARVDAREPGALEAALRDGLGFVRVALRGGWTVLPDGSAFSPRDAPGLGTDRALLRALFALGPAASFELSGRVAGLEGLRREHGGRVAVRPSRSTRLYRYQLSVANALGAPALWQRVLAPAELYHAEHVAAVVRLRGLPDGEPYHGPLRLLGRAVPAPSVRSGVAGRPVEDPRRLVEPLEIADPDLVIVDARRLGWGGDEITQPAWPLGAVIVADSVLAAELACCAVLGVDPAAVPSIQQAAARGLGPGRLDEVEFAGTPAQEFARRVAGFGGHPPELASLPDWVEARLGARLPLEIAVGEGPGPSASLVARSLLRWLDMPAGLHRMADWGSLGVVVGEPAALPDRRHLLLVGDAAIARYRRAHPDFTTWVRTPAALGIFPAAVHAVRVDGELRWAWELPGDPPRADSLELGFLLASLGRMRPPLLAALLSPRRRLWRWLAGLQRARRNRAGVPVVHARKIVRLVDRPWRKALPPLGTLERADPLAPPDPPVQ